MAPLKLCQGCKGFVRHSMEAGCKLRPEESCRGNGYSEGEEEKGLDRPW